MWFVGGPRRHKNVKRCSSLFYDCSKAAFCFYDGNGNAKEKKPFLCISVQTQNSVSVKTWISREQTRSSLLSEAERWCTTLVQNYEKCRLSTKKKWCEHLHTKIVASVVETRVFFYCCFFPKICLFEKCLNMQWKNSLPSLQLHCVKCTLNVFNLYKNVLLISLSI